MKNKIKMMRLYGGEYLIGEINPVQGRSDAVSVLNPRIFSVMPSFGGHASAGFRHVCMFTDKFDAEISVKNGQIFFEIDEDELPKEILNGYLSEVSGIDIASAADVPDLTGAPKAGSFSL